MDKPNDLDISTTKSNQQLAIELTDEENEAINIICRKFNKALKNEEPYDTRDLVNDIAGFRDIIIRNEDS